MLLLLLTGYGLGVLLAKVFILALVVSFIYLLLKESFKSKKKKSVFHYTAPDTTEIMKEVKILEEDGVYVGPYVEIKNIVRDFPDYILLVPLYSQIDYHNKKDTIEGIYHKKEQEILSILANGKYYGFLTSDKKNERIDRFFDLLERLNDNDIDTIRIILNSKFYESIARLRKQNRKFLT